MGVYLGGGEGGMAEKFLYGVYVGPFVEHGGGKGMAEGMWAFFACRRRCQRFFDGAVYLLGRYPFPFHHK